VKFCAKKENWQKRQCLELSGTISNKIIQFLRFKSVLCGFKVVKGKNRKKLQSRISKTGFKFYFIQNFNLFGNCITLYIFLNTHIPSNYVTGTKWKIKKTRLKNRPLMNEIWDTNWWHYEQLDFDFSFDESFICYKK